MLFLFDILQTFVKHISKIYSSKICWSICFSLAKSCNIILIIIPYPTVSQNWPNKKEISSPSNLFLGPFKTLTFGPKNKKDFQYL